MSANKKVVDIEVKTYELAEADYMNGMKYKDIADKHGVSINTVKSWKKRYAWNRDRGAPQNKKVAHKGKKGCTQNEKGCIQDQKSIDEKKETVAEGVRELINNPELNDKQMLFCLLYIRCFNATKAYQKAYGSSYITAMQNGCKLLRNTKVKEEIQKLKQDRVNRELFTEEDVFRKYIDIAFADIKDYTEFGKKEVAYVDKRGMEHKAEISYVDLKECDEVDGTIISEISQGKDGVKVKLADRLKALQWLSDHMDLTTEKQRAEIELLRARTKTDDGEELEDDGFIDALNGSAKEDWSDEEEDSE